MFGQALVHEGIVGIEKIQHRPVLAHDAFKQQFRFALKSLAQVVVEIGKLAPIGIGTFQSREDRATARRSCPRALRPIVRQHPPRLALQDGGFMQLIFESPDSVAHRRGCWTTGKTTSAKPVPYR